MSASPATEGRFTGRGWTLTVTSDGVLVIDRAGPRELTADQVARLQVRRSWFRWGLYTGARRILLLRGLSSAGAAELVSSLRLREIAPHLDAAVRWYDQLAWATTTATTTRRWLTTETIDLLAASRPDPQLVEYVRATAFDRLLTERQRAALPYLSADLDAIAATVNHQVTAAELDERRGFFDTIEKTPLTDEQARAVICFDNRVQVLAAAGSGKTSVMVARAAYAVERKFIDPDRILLLAFNKAAAAELQQRISERFATAGIDATGVRASTFHAFGLETIGRATGRKPRLAPWLDHGQDVHTVMEIVDELRDSSPQFRYQWDLYRLLFATAPTDLNANEPDTYDRETRETGYRTCGGQMVKSHGERLIADFLHYNGIRYRYEHPYAVDVADATHAQYRPDFYYPDLNVWHEHWALDRDGNPPEDFVGYAQSIDWKRSLHRHYGTTLLETTWGQVVHGDGLAQFERDLTARGANFDWNPDRPSADPWTKPMKHEDLARFIRTFMAHVKSNGWTRADLEQRLVDELPWLRSHRTRLFLDLYWPVHAAWEKRLADDGSVDFEDMLVQAAAHLESGRLEQPFELIMVDEFQDVSRARARLVRGLVNRPGRYLLAVGDDWQAINRFAGADLSVMTGFADWFGRGRQLSLTTTFRCTQTICDVARTFVAKNPSQFDKPMRSAHTGHAPPVRIVRAADAATALRETLQALSNEVNAGNLASANGTVLEVDVLGRYRFERDLIPARIPSNLQVTFRTVHGSKGLEADVVVVPNLSTGTYGFPSSITDDPVLDLAMPTPERFPHAEERRLLYVALTRARREVVLIAPDAQVSPFIAELVGQPGVKEDGETVTQACQCGQGVMVQRTGPYGTFLGCSTFPVCRNKSKL